jgi:poly-beta-1,6-N-acetyl-D-glucosamine synthase
METENSLAQYVLVTPAHNEASFIEQTILAMLAQTIKPVAWILVNDNSSDATGDIIEKYAQAHDFIRLVNVQRAEGRHFGNKVHAFNKGLAELGAAHYSFIGNLDADITLDKDYFKNILAEFGKDPALGLAGGMVYTQIGSNNFVSQDVALDSVAGAVQLFRRECFEQVGGYIPLPYGGIDTAAEIMARMNGWKTRTFEQYPVYENRRTGSATLSPLAAKVKEGRLLHSLGYDFYFFIVRCLYRITDPPIIIGSAAICWGYMESMVKRNPIALPPNAIQFLRSEQRKKLLRFIRYAR